jgi:cytosine deaminase
MMARNDDGNQRRGVCPVHLLNSYGVNAAYATNNIQNLFTFTGDGDVLKIGTLVCQVLQLTSESNAKLCLDMATIKPAKALGIDHGIKEGCMGDLILVEGSSAMEILAAPSVRRLVFRKGKLVSETKLSQNFYK